MKTKKSNISTIVGIATAGLLVVAISVISVDIIRRVTSRSSNKNKTTQYNEDK